MIFLSTATDTYATQCYECIGCTLMHETDVLNNPNNKKIVDCVEKSYCGYSSM